MPKSLENFRLEIVSFLFMPAPGRTAFVAKVHQEGENIKPNRYAKPTQYPIRKLVGFSLEDENWIEREIQTYLVR